MSFIQGGIRNATTKKALKEAVKDDPSSVRFYSTGLGGEQFDGPVTTLSANGTKLTVVGPDPYTARSWYATIERAANGQIKVS